MSKQTKEKLYHLANGFIGFSPFSVILYYGGITKNHITAIFLSILGLIMLLIKAFLFIRNTINENEMLEKDKMCAKCHCQHYSETFQYKNKKLFINHLKQEHPEKYEEITDQFVRIEYKKLLDKYKKKNKG